MRFKRDTPLRRAASNLTWYRAVTSMLKLASDSDTVISNKLLSDLIELS